MRGERGGRMRQNDRERGGDEGRGGEREEDKI